MNVANLGGALAPLGREATNSSSTVQSNQLANIFICDPVCVQGLGHNLAAVNRYSDYLSLHGISTTAYVSKLLANSSALRMPKQTRPVYSHYYAKTISVANAENDSSTASILATEPPDVEALIHKIALQELEQILSEVAEPQTTGIFYPSIDYYSFRALVHFLEENSDKFLPTLFVRWIGVMENCRYGFSNDFSLTQLCARLSQVITRCPHLRIYHSTECDTYSEKMSQLLNVHVASTPSLFVEELLPFPSNASFTICFPGSARIDKGFNRIPHILSLLDSRYPSLDYRVYLQLLPAHELVHHYNIVRDVLKNCRVKCYPSHVSKEVLSLYIAASSILVAPYCNRIYELRSSAIMAEGACFGRQIVSSTGCGFSNELSSLGLGVCCKDDYEVADSIYHYSQLSQTEMIDITNSARSNYHGYANRAYANFFKF